MKNYNCISQDVKLGEKVRLSKFVNLYGCEIGSETKIGAFVEIQKNARIGSRCKISGHSFICEGVVIEDEVFVGHGVTFINDTYPRATVSEGNLQTEAEYRVEPTVVREGASIGSGVTVLPNVTIGENAIVGAGSVVTRDVPRNAIVAGNPARILRFIVPPENACEPVAVPFLDLVTPNVELESELVRVFRQGLQTAGFVGVSMVEDFERCFAAFCKVDYCTAVSSGTDALRFALIASGVKPGDVVITVPNTFIATTEAISQAGAIPEFIDVDEHSLNMSPMLLQRFLETQCTLDLAGRPISLRNGKRVTAVVPVHLYGQMADMDSILKLANLYELVVVEDACQAHGAEYFSAENNRWMKAGSMGHAAAFSFYPGTNLGACGEGGAVTTNDAAIAGTIAKLRDHGQAKKYFHDFEGYNGRLDAIQAGILQVKLPHLSAWNSQRRERAAEYNRLLANNEAIILPYEPSWSSAVYQLYVIRTADPSGLMNHLKMASIGTGIHYPIPLHLQRAYAFLGYEDGAFPIAERVASEIVSLPMFPHLTEKQQSRVAEEVQAFISQAMQGVSF